ncbi:MAG: hypothetical protein RJA99_2970 [Pseudomonadota bacterium]|jgi:PAS domain S-box-containing protein
MDTRPPLPDAAAPRRRADRSLLARLGFGRAAGTPAAASSREASGGEPQAAGRLETAAEGSPRVDEAALRAVVDGLQDGLVVIDDAGRIVRCNRAAAAMFGQPARALHGTPADALLPEDALRAGPTGLGGRRRRIEARRHDGTAFAADIASAPIEVDGVRHLVVLLADASLVELGERELGSVRAAALDASRAKSRFLVNMSHEARTPMNGLLGLAALLRDTALSDTQRGLVDGLERSAETLRSLIDRVLEVADLETGRLPLHQSDFDPVEAVEDALARVALRAAHKGLAIGYAFDGDAPPPMHGDDRRFREVLRHLLDNAVSFTVEGHVQVRLSFRDAERLLEVRVVDSGPGVPAVQRRRLFQAFCQVDESASRSHGGVGLGLAICRHLTELMGGAIDVGDAPGGGAAFRFTVAWHPPTQRTALADARSRVARLTGRAVAVAGIDPMQRAQLAAWGLQLREPAAAAREPRLPLLVAADDRTALAFAQRIAAARATQAAAPVVLATSRAVAAAPALPRIERPMRARALAAALDGTAEPGRPGDARPSARQPEDTATGRPTGTPYGAALLAAPPAPDPAAPPARATTEGVAAPSAVADPQHAEPRRRVLVVEDNAVNQLLAVALLQRLGVEPAVVGDGTGALERLAASPWDAVLMDVQMPGLDGLETTQRWRQAERAQGLARTPVIALTANATDEDRERCLAAGMDDYLAKPLDRTMLEARLARWVGATGPVAG